MFRAIWGRSLYMSPEKPSDDTTMGRSVESKSLDTIFLARLAEVEDRGVSNMRTNSNLSLRDGSMILF